jgi:hypothetical protein
VIDVTLRDGDNLVFSSPLQQAERRAGLRRLDDILGALEELNIREEGVIPTSLKQKLREEGVPVQGHTISDLIDLVLGSQEPFLLRERRIGPRRRRRTFILDDEDLASVILGRFGT